MFIKMSGSGENTIRNCNDCNMDQLKDSLDNLSLATVPGEYSKNHEHAYIQTFSSDIKLCDSDPENDITLYSYVNCNDKSHRIIKETRGAVFKGDQKIFSGFPYTPEYTLDDFNIKIDYGNVRFFKSQEGTLIRFFFSNKWYMSTHRKLNAFRSKWGSNESFGNLFVKGLWKMYTEREDFRKVFGNDVSESEIFEKFVEKLDKNCQYIFLVGNTNENRIVSLASEQPLYHIGTYINNKFSIDHNMLLPKPVELKFQDYNQMCEYVNEKSFTTRQGVILFIGPEFTQQIKLVNKEYQFLYNIRGNQPSIKFRYLQLRNDKEMSKHLYFLYPRFADIFDGYERTLYEIANKINTAYIRRFIKKTHIVVPKEEYKVMQDCHQWHIADRDRNKISFQKVLEILNKQDATTLNKMIRNFKNGETEKVNTRPRAHSKDARIKTVNMEM